MTYLAIAVVGASVAALMGNKSAGINRLLLPTNLVLIILVSIFGVRPLVVREPIDFDLYGVDVREGIGRAVLIGAVGTASYLVGILFGRGQGQDEGVPATLKKRRVPITTVAAVSAGCAGLWAASIVALTGVGTLVLLVQGRSEALSMRIAAVPTVFAAIPAGASVAVALYLLYEVGTRKLTKSECLVLLLSLACAVVPNTLAGNRRFLLPAVLAPVVAYSLAHRGRISARLTIAGAAVLPVFMVLPYVRSAGAREAGQSTLSAAIQYLRDGGVSSAIRNFFVSYGTEMLNYVAFLGDRVGTSLPYGYGRATVGQFFQFPLPVGSGGEGLWEDRILTGAFGGGCADVACPVPSVVGVLFLDGGLVIVCIGMLLLGFTLKRFEIRLLRRGTTRSLVVLVLISAYSPVAARTYTINAIWWLIYTLLVSAVVVKCFPRLDKAQSASDA